MEIMKAYYVTTEDIEKTTEANFGGICKVDFVSLGEYHDDADELIIIGTDSEKACNKFSMCGNAFCREDAEEASIKVKDVVFYNRNVFDEVYHINMIIEKERTSPEWLETSLLWTVTKIMFPTEDIVSVEWRGENTLLVVTR